MDKTELKKFAASLGISEIGVSRAVFSQKLYDMLAKHRERFASSPFEEGDLSLRCDPSKVLPGAASVITCLFPYHSRKISPKNLSRYACIRDYHEVAREKLHAISEYITVHSGAECVCFADNGPLCDRFLAYQAGLGFYGKNHMLINETFGSYFFIGSVLTTAEFEADKPLDAVCRGCGTCMDVCPGGALAEDGFDFTRCLSYITQAKELTKEQEELLSGQKTVYGCDACQESCPHNAHLQDTILAEFAGQTLEQIPEDILAMSNREFQRKYHGFPFAWRGRRTIARNLQKKT